MHEYVLFGQVADHEHKHVLQQLTGLTRMPPRQTTEAHLVFKARQPDLLGITPSVGGSQDIVPAEVQKTRALLNGSLFFVQLVGERVPDGSDGAALPNDAPVAADVVMGDNETSRPSRSANYWWNLEFKDIPDAGKHAVTTRLVSRTRMQDGNILRFLSSFGFDYVSRYQVVGNAFYDQDTRIFLYRAFHLPEVSAEELSLENFPTPPPQDLQLVDRSGGYAMEVSIDVVDGNNPELKDRATKQLMAMKETLKQSITLSAGDRLALDTRVPVGRRG